MKQDPRGQIPGIDLTFAGGKAGRIWGRSGIDDIRGASFKKAAKYVRERAALDGAFRWTIDIELDLVVSAAAASLLEFIRTLDDVIREAPDRRAITVRWLIPPGDESMMSHAGTASEEVTQRANRAAIGGKPKVHLILAINPEPAPPAKTA